MHDGKRFFRTGDLGTFVDNKFLKITGRIKEQYKLENGKYVVPAPLEDEINRSAFIAQSLVFGADQKFNIALIVPDMIELQPWLVKQGIIPANSSVTISEVIAFPQVATLIADEVRLASIFISNM